jgi:hypothetical protein
MFGCLRRIGCLFVILLVVVGYLTRGYWWRPARAVVSRSAGIAAAPGDTVSGWESLTPERAERGEREVRALAAPHGPVYVSLRPGELASYAFLSLASALPASARDAQAAVIDDRVYIRSVVSLRDFAGALGALGGLVGERDTLRLGGTFDVLAPGRAEFRVQDVQIGNVPVPEKLIPSLVRRVRKRAPTAGVAPDALEIPVPDYIGDVRIARGRITLYKRQ